MMNTETVTVNRAELLALVELVRDLTDAGMAHARARELDERAMQQLEPMTDTYATVEATREAVYALDLEIVGKLYTLGNGR